MTDTPRLIQDRYRRMLMQRPGPERLRMGCEMFDAARALVRASLGDARGVDHTPEFNARLFLRTYAGDFTAEQTARIIAHLLQSGRIEAAQRR
jgi:hypothetical protein